MFIPFKKVLVLTLVIEYGDYRVLAIGIEWREEKIVLPISSQMRLLFDDSFMLYPDCFL